MVSRIMIREPLKPEGFENSPLCSIVVRPVTPDERQMWDRLMSQYHYLGLKSLVGKSIRYVAEVQGRWLALLGWAASALKCQPRDTWIGWSQAIQWQRLHLIERIPRCLRRGQNKHNLMV
jgi:hypothetical protein